jgi:hypothetical protein
MNYQELNGKSLALLLAAEDEDWSVLSGVVRQEGGALLLDRGANEQPFLIQPEWIDRIKPVPTDLMETLMNAEFLPFNVGTLPDNADSSDYIHTGLKLPK